MDIKFGTDGWRGVIARDFTFVNLKRAAQAVVDYTKKHVKCNPSAVIGYDTRFMSAQYARLVASVFSGNKIKTVLADHVTPTPMLSYGVKNLKKDFGIMITASHNPAIYNGFKYKEKYGCSSFGKTTKVIEGFIDNSKVKVSEDLIKEKNIVEPYINVLKKYLNKSWMRRKKFTIVIDSMYGAGGMYLEEILKSYGHKVVTIHGKPNSLFPNLDPEPIEKNLKELSKAVLKEKAHIGIATDGDADRVGVVDGKGRFVTPHDVLSLLFLHLKESRGWSGKVVKTISTTSRIEKIAKKYNVSVLETPVGFKYIAERMVNEDILIGGEESGGNGFKKHIPERDGLLSGLLLVEMMGREKKNLVALLKEMEKEYGPYKYKRIDAHVPRKKIDILFKKLRKTPPKKISNYKVVEIKKHDGIKFIFEDNSWLLIRASGTEPLLRLYCEASSINKVNSLISSALRMVK